MDRNYKFISIYSLSAVLTHLLLIPFTTEKITGYTNEAAKSSSKAQRNPPSYTFISCFTVSVTPSVNTPEASNDFMILIISFKCSFEINKAKPFPAFTTYFSLIFRSNLFIRFQIKLLTNRGKLSLSEEISIFVIASFSKLPNQEPNIYMIELF